MVQERNVSLYMMAPHAKQPQYMMVSTANCKKSFSAVKYWKYQKSLQVRYRRDKVEHGLMMEYKMSDGYFLIYIIIFSDLSLSGMTSPA